MTLGNEADEAASHRLLDRFVEAGGTFVDTADVLRGTRVGGDHRVNGSGTRADHAGRQP
jgi:hypothetical protein